MQLKTKLFLSSSALQNYMNKVNINYINDFLKKKYNGFKINKNSNTDIQTNNLFFHRFHLQRIKIDKIVATL